MSEETSFVGKIVACVEHLRASDCDGESDEYKTSLRWIVRGVEEGKLKLHRLVELLADSLTDTVILKRSAGTFFLVDVIESLGPNALADEEISYFVDFFCDRLKDNVLVIPYAVRGLSILSDMSRLPPGRAKQILLAVFKEVQVQAHSQQVRSYVFVVFGNLLRSKLPEVRELGQEFVYGFVQAMDGEKDPRNLMILFNMVPLVIQKFPIDAFVDEFFEVVSCYFPIDFSPPPNAPHGVTQQTLIDSLRKCLASTPLFAPHCIPLLLEKLDSDLEPAKVDALNTLAACCEPYGAKNLAPFFHVLWTSIRREMFLSCSEKVCEACLDAVVSVIKSLSSSVVKADSRSLLNDFVEEILNECKKYLSEPELKLIQPSSKIIVAAASASIPACHLVLGSVVPLLLDQFLHHEQSNRKVTILEIMLSFLDVYVQKVLKNPEVVEFDWNDVINLCLNHLHSDDEEICYSAMKGIEIGLGVPKFLSDAQCRTLEESLVVIALKSDDSLRSRSVEVLQKLAFAEPSVITSSTIPKMINFVSDVSNNPADECTEYFVSLLILGKVCNLESSAKLVSKMLMQHITDLAAENSKLTGKKITGCIKCLQEIVAQLTQSCKDELLLECVFYPLLIIMVGVTNSFSVLRNAEVVTAVGDLFSSIVMQLNADQSRNVVDKTLNCLDVDNGSSSLTDKIVLLKSVVCYVPTKSSAFVPENFLRRMESIAYGSTEEDVAEAAMCILASIVNKLPEDSKALEKLLVKLKETAVEKLQKDNVDVQRRSLSLWIWITKALVFRGHKVMGEFVAKLIDCFGNVNLGKIAARGFRIILNEHDFMSARSHAEIRFLYHQRLFTIAISPLIQGFNGTPDDKEQVCYLTAVNHLLCFLPHHVLTDAGHPLIPLLIQTLSLDDSDLPTIALNTLNGLLVDVPESMSSYVTLLVPCLLKVAASAPTMKERIMGLNCLDSLTKQPVHALLPVRNDVVHSLAACVDDKKRLVRQQAVTTRCNWYFIGEP